MNFIISIIILSGSNIMPNIEVIMMPPMNIVATNSNKNDVYSSLDLYKKYSPQHKD